MRQYTKSRNLGKRLFPSRVILAPLRLVVPIGAFRPIPHPSCSHSFTHFRTPLLHTIIFYGLCPTVSHRFLSRSHSLGRWVLFIFTASAGWILPGVARVSAWIIHVCCREYTARHGPPAYFYVPPQTPRSYSVSHPSVTLAFALSLSHIPFIPYRLSLFVYASTRFTSYRRVARPVFTSLLRKWPTSSATSNPSLKFTLLFRQRPFSIVLVAFFSRKRVQIFFCNQFPQFMWVQ